MKKKHTKILSIGEIILAIAIIIATVVLLRSPRVEFPTEAIVDEPQPEITEESSEELVDVLSEEERKAITEQDIPAVLDHESWEISQFDNFKMTLLNPNGLEWETSDIRQVIVNDQEYGDHGFGLIKVPGDDYASSAVLSVASYADILGRGGYWGDIAAYIDDEVSCEALLESNIAKDCDMFVNENGLDVAHLVSDFVGFGSEAVLINIYIIAHPDTEIKSVALSDSRILPTSYTRVSSITTVLNKLGFTTVQSRRDLVRTMAETVDFTE